jgi:hypothetical protein
LQLQKLQRKWKVIPKLALQKFSQFECGSFGGSIGRPKKSKAVPFFGTGLRDDPGGPLLQVAAQHCAAKLVKPQRNKDSKLAVAAKGFSLV